MGSRAMNRKQVVVMWAGIIVFVLMGLFPRWTMEGKMTTMSVYALSQHRFLLSPPSRPYGDTGKTVSYHRIDTTTLTIEWAIVVVVSGGLILTLTDKKDGESKDKER